MSIHKKTRKQKIIADYRRKSYVLENKSIPTLVSEGFPKISENNLNSQSYVLHDLRKTGLLTLSIIAAQIILFILLKNHLIELPKITY